MYIVYVFNNVPVCPRDTTACADQSRCYATSLKCNGFNDCADGSDEIDCPSMLYIIAFAEIS
jgi:uncharacterized membrane protein